MTTHLAVALAVKSGEADAGMGVYSAAKTLGLEFVPVATERYEIAIRREHLDDPRVAELCAAITSSGFQGRLWTGLGVTIPGDRRAALTALITASSGVVHVIPLISHVFMPKDPAICLQCDGNLREVP